jgi:antitoxin CptB
MGSDSTATRRKRLRHRSRYRGFREADLLFGAFADRHLDSLSEEQLDQYERLLDESDEALWAWVTGARPVPARHDHELMRRLQKLDYARIEGVAPPGQGVTF